MEYECKKCGTSFTKYLGQAKCPKCGNKDFWITGGISKQIFLFLAILGLLLIVTFLFSFVAFFGVLIGTFFALPISVYNLYTKYKRLKKRD